VTVNTRKSYGTDLPAKKPEKRRRKGGAKGKKGESTPHPLGKVEKFSEEGKKQGTQRSVSKTDPRSEHGFKEARFVVPC